jgi:hypothetical protein
LGSQGVEIDKKPAQDLKQVFQQVENPIPIPTPAPKAPERAEIDRPAPRLYDRVLSVAAEIRDRFFAFFKSDDSTRPAPSKPTPPASSMDRSQGGATSSPDPAPQYQPPPPPRDQQLDDLRAMQQRDSQQRQRERMSAAELQAMLDRQQRHGQEHGPER